MEIFYKAVKVKTKLLISSFMMAVWYKAENFEI